VSMVMAVMVMMVATIDKSDSECLHHMIPWTWWLRSPLGRLLLNGQQYDSGRYRMIKGGSPSLMYVQLGLLRTCIPNIIVVLSSIIVKCSYHRL
jgi:hypothetical protein